MLDDVAPTVIVVAEDADASHLEGKAQILRVPRAESGLDLPIALKALRGQGIESVLLEGGPTLAGSFLAGGFVDVIVGYIAPVAIGGTGKSALAGPGAPSIGDAWRWEIDECERLGPDIRITARPL
jgi:diaminohydroxyphosphoribosylaminopyrimidine deaminase/5-amino-6-(5-phosphoribosylamino)uracil reductase